MFLMCKRFFLCILTIVSFVNNTDVQNHAINQKQAVQKAL